MSRTFADSVAYDLANTFFNTNEFAEAVTLGRNANETSGVAAIVSTRNYEVVDEEGLLTFVESMDFDFPATSYVIGGSQVDPRPGDRVVTADGVSHQVLPVGRRPCFEPVGQSGLVIRVHTKRAS